MNRINRLAIIVLLSVALSFTIIGSLWSQGNDDAQSTTKQTALQMKEQTYSNINSSESPLQRIDNEVAIQNKLITNPYQNVDWENTGRYKANFHTHTTESDGRLTVEETVMSYSNNDYSILMITDHDSHSPQHVNTWPWTNYETDPDQPPDFTRDPETGVVTSINMLTAEGNELSRTHHHGSFDCDWAGTPAYTLEESLNQIRDRGGMSMLYHPGRYNHGVQYYTDLYNAYAIDVLFGLEVYNQGDRYSGDRQLWDNILTELMPERPVWAYSNDDMHRESHLYRNYNIMLMPDLTISELRNAWAKGASYSSYEEGGSGDARAPHVNQIVIDEPEGTIRIVSGNTDNYLWIADGETIGNTNELDYQYNRDINGYARIVLTNEFGTTLLNPFGFEQVKGSLYPDIAAFPQPGNEAEVVSLDLERLNWNYFEHPMFINPEGFKVYFNTSGEFDEEDDYEWVPYIEGETEYEAALNLSEELYGYTKYYWQVVPTNNHGQAEDPLVWSFTTEPFPYPVIAGNPGPPPNANDVSTELSQLSWSYEADSSYAVPAGFRVYINRTGFFDDEHDYEWVPYVPDRQQYTASEILPEQLSYFSNYRWKVVPTTVDHHNMPGDRDIEGQALYTMHRSDAQDIPVWSFRTERYPYPVAAINPNPEDASKGVSIDLGKLSWQYTEDRMHRNPAGFRVYFNDDKDFDVDDYEWVPYVENQVNYSLRRISHLNIDYDKTYYWQVIPTTIEPENISLATIEVADIEEVRYHTNRDMNSRTQSTNHLQLTAHDSLRGDAENCPVWSFSTEIDTSVPIEETTLVTELKQNYPNPFNPHTSIQYSIREKTKVQLTIYNLKGQEVNRLVDDVRTRGKYRVSWDGTDERGEQMPAGIYVYRLQTEDYEQVNKMMLVK